MPQSGGACRGTVGWGASGGGGCLTPVEARAAAAWEGAGDLGETRPCAPCPSCLALPAAAQGLAPDPALVAEGGRLFADHCAGCHGVEARGDGPMVQVLAVPVPDLTGLAARNEGLPHLDVVTKTYGRDPVVGHGSAMPVWGPVFDGVEGAFVRTEAGQPIVTSVPIAALVAWLEGVQE